jgi:hypothetical protein
MSYPSISVWVLSWMMACGIACDRAEEKGGAGAAGREQHYTAFALKFGEALKSENYAAAYEMTSKHYRAAHSLQAFTDLVQQAQKRYGKATHLGAGFNTVEADGPLGEGLGFPKDVPAADRRARLLVRMANGPDAINDCVYEVWLNVIHEGGTDRIVTIEIPGINM